MREAICPTETIGNKMILEKKRGKNLFTYLNIYIYTRILTISYHYYPQSETRSSELNNILFKFFEFHS